MRAPTLLLVVLALGLAAAPALARPFPRMGAGCVRTDFASAGATVRAAFCSSAAARASGRAVVVLHGCGGFDTLDHRLAQDLPASGTATLYLDYFAPTPPPGRKGFCDTFGRARDAFETWLDEVDAAAATLRREPGVRRIGVVGWSLGGYLAVFSAERSPALFGAVVAFSAGAHGALSARLPPLLVLSGGRTDAIPLADSEQLVQAARAAGTHTELFVWPRGSHSWPGAQGEAGRARAAGFLARFLR